MPPPNPELVVREAAVYESRSEQDVQTMPVLNSVGDCKRPKWPKRCLIGIARVSRYDRMSAAMSTSATPTGMHSLKASKIRSDHEAVFGANLPLPAIRIIVPRAPVIGGGYP
jgi:hypothetical protein